MKRFGGVVVNRPELSEMPPAQSVGWLSCPLARMEMSSLRGKTTGLHVMKTYIYLYIKWSLKIELKLPIVFAGGDQSPRYYNFRERGNYATRDLLVCVKTWAIQDLHLPCVLSWF